jgi:hypothetical protein
MPEKLSIPPSLPPYEKPVDRQPAVIPDSLKPHGIINKFIGQMLKAPKMKQSMKMMSMKKNPKPLPKMKKKKVL